MGNRSPKIDAYIAKAGAFAQPILRAFRERVHAAVPGVDEDVKWGAPFFLLRGQMLASMASFKAHCGFNVFRLKGEGEGGSQQRIANWTQVTTLEDTPSDKELGAALSQAQSSGAAVKAAKPVTQKAKAKKPAAQKAKKPTSQKAKTKR